MYWSVTFGAYTLDQRDGQLWLTTEGGEGMEVKPEEMEKLLREYYEANF